MRNGPIPRGVSQYKVAESWSTVQQRMHHRYESITASFPWMTKDQAGDHSLIGDIEIPRTTAVQDAENYDVCRCARSEHLLECSEVGEGGGGVAIQGGRKALCTSHRVSTTLICDCIIPGHAPLLHSLQLFVGTDP